MRQLANTLICFGAAGVGIFLATQGEALVYERIDTARFNQELAKPQFSPVKPSPAVVEAEQQDEGSTDLPSRTSDGVFAQFQLFAALSLPPTGVGVIARLEIPDVGISTLVREGLDGRTLRRGAGHMPGTALPGRPGNFVIAGHRDTIFRNLRFIKTGDTIRITNEAGVFEYTVASLSVVDPQYVEALQPTTEPKCTLVTCFPFGLFGPAPKRFLVQAVKKSRTAVE
jgi:LPXTG-site transpeptidase (sortase) family protein